MSRASRVPYHQNVYDLLQLEPGVSPDAALMIAEHEARYGPLPASVREWYLVPNVVVLNSRENIDSAVLWHQYSEEDWPTSLPEVLDQYVQAQENSAFPYICLADENQGALSWWMTVDGSDDPPVYRDDGYRDDPSAWIEVGATFSAFLALWFTEYYSRPYTPLARNGSRAREKGSPPFVKPYRNGLWLRTPDEPFQPPVIDFLTEVVGEPERTSRPDRVTTYTFRPIGGTIRITADEPSLTGGLSAWWIHADTPERLAELVALLFPWGTLRETLRADTDAAREVLRRACRV